MDIAYYERRLRAELRAVETATNSCAKVAHQELAIAYRARLTLLRCRSIKPSGRGAARARPAAVIEPAPSREAA